MAKVHLSVEGRPGCRVGLRDGAEHLNHVTDERLLTCLACLRLAADRRRHRVITNLRKQGALLDVAEGRPNVIRLNRQDGVTLP